MLLVNSFDVEPWWASTPPCIDPSEWGGMPDRSERPMAEYLDLCDQAGVRSTFFFIGWYARTFPERVREVVARGHEVGCHSLMHEDVSTQTDQAFRAATRDAKAMIEDAGGVPVEAYRAPSFSFPPARVAELLGILVDLGFTTDSSITTAGRVYGGGHSADEYPGPMHLGTRMGLDLVEVPVPGARIAGRELAVFGGGYLRLAPRALVTHLARRESYQVLYLHPHDFDRRLPPLPNTGRLSNLRRTLRIGDLREKLLDLFAMSDVRTCGDLAAEHRAARPAAA